MNTAQNNKRVQALINLLILTFLLAFTAGAAADTVRTPTADALSLTDRSDNSSFPLVRGRRAAKLYLSDQDFPGVHKVAGHLRNDIERVTGRTPALETGRPEGKVAVVIGTLGKNRWLDELAASGKIQARAVAGRWDTFALETVANPWPDVEQALVIYGSDKRGTIYGMYELSRLIGVSPWHYWADVPVEHRDTLYLKAGFYSLGEPKIKYRGIFINDEAPALSGWAKKTFGGFNSAFYEKVFELILRNRGNFLWPAMWPPSAFNDDDPESARLADELGVVMSTSHHEPMMRAHDEWRRFGGDEWNYETNADQLREFWRGGIERMGDKESIVTVGMRGDGDEAMSENTATDLMRRIIRDQRRIIEQVTGQPARETPQVWALYKEAQDYYDQGVRVPDDVTLLLCDDNWGNVRFLPKAADLDHPGGFGIYYHFDFVGGPVSYRWLNVTQIEKVWEQMNLAYQWGARKIWLVNVGDIKPMELPTSFFLDYAWNPEAMTAEDLPDYYTQWAAAQFGEELAREIGDILRLQTKYIARRTPEMITPDTFSLQHYREAEQVVADYKSLLARAEKVNRQLPEAARPAFYQLVLYPTAATANLTEMYVTAGKNRWYAEQGRASADRYADLTRQLFDRDAELAERYHQLLDGKWQHMMDQTRIGYTSWANPPIDKMPAVSYVRPLDQPALGVWVESAGKDPYSFAEFDPLNDQKRFFELFNKSAKPFDFKIAGTAAWLKLSTTAGTLKTDTRIMVSIDWDQVPAGRRTAEIIIRWHDDEREARVIKVPVRKVRAQARGFIANNGVVSMEANHFSRARNTNDVRWLTVPNLGRTGSAVTLAPANAKARLPRQNAPYLEYDFTLFEAGEVTLHSHLSPTLNFHKTEGLKFAVAIDDGAPVVVNIHEDEVGPDWDYPAWFDQIVADHIRIEQTAFGKLSAGPHTLKVWMIDAGLVFQKFVLDAGGLQPSYLGPPPSVRVQ